MSKQTEYEREGDQYIADALSVSGSDSIICRGSEIGHCLRALTAQHLGYEPTEKPKWLERAAREGTRHEEWIREDLREMGYQIDNAQAETELLTDGIRLVGHIDGFFHHRATKQSGLLEIKTMGEYEFRRWRQGRFGVFPSYAWQISAYHAALVEGNWLTITDPILYAVKNRSSGYLDLQIIEQPPHSSQAVIDRLTVLRDCVASHVLAEAEYELGSIECDRCLYHYLCVEPDVVIDDEELILAAEQWRAAREARIEAQDEEERCTELLKSHVRAVAPEQKYSYTVSGVQIVQYSTTRVSYPKEQLESTVPEEYLSQVRKTDKSWQCRITDKENISA